MAPRVTRYVCDQELKDAWEGRSQGWKLHDEIRSVQIGNTILKSRFAPLETIGAFIERLRSIGYQRYPSSFGEGYHAIAGKQVVSKSYIAAGPQRVYGPWEERLPSAPGLRQYDLVSAYGWAGMTAPLPDARYSRPVRGFKAYPRPGERGIWFGTWTPPKSLLLPPYLRECETEPKWCTHEEVHRLCLTPIKIERGIVFERFNEDVKTNLEKVGDAFPEFKKKIYRSYWGLWSAPAGPIQSTPTKERQLPNPFRNPALAHFIDSRVRVRMAYVAQRSSLVYVDAVVTAARLKTGTAPGDWREVPIGKAARRFKAAVEGWGYQWTGERRYIPVQTSRLERVESKSPSSNSAPA